MKDVVNYLIENNLTISTMESCTGGALANAITNVPDASKIFSFSAVTYSVQSKVKMGVDSKIIDEHTVYSIEVAKEMSKKISKYTDSVFGVGITGKFGKTSPNNPYEKDNIVYISLFDKRDNSYFVKEVEVTKIKRSDNKNEVIDAFIEMFNIKFGL